MLEIPSRTKVLVDYSVMKLKRLLSSWPLSNPSPWPDISQAKLPIRARLSRRHPLHRDRQSAISALRQRDELSIGADRIKHRIDARFHHFFRADGVVALVLIEVPPE